MTPPRHVKHLLLLLLGAAVGSVLTLYLRPHPSDAPSPLYRGLSPAELALDRRLPEIDLRGLNLRQAAERMSKAWDVPIDVNWGSIPEKSGWRGRKLTFRGRQVALREVLSYALAAPNEDQLGFECQAGVILLAPPEVLGNLSVVRVYDVDDLVRAPWLVGAITPAPMDAGSSQQRLFGNQQQQVDDGGEMTVEECIENLTRMLEETVDPDSWRDNGGSVGAIRAVGSRLLIGQVRENHRAIARVLAELRCPTAPPPEAAPAASVYATWDDEARQFVVRDASAAERALREIRPAVDIVDLNLTEAIQLLSATWSVPIHEQPNNAAFRRVAVRMKDVPLRTALRAVLQGVADEGRLGYCVNDGIIAVGNVELLSPETKVYDLRYWLRPLADDVDRRRFLASLKVAIENLWPANNARSHVCCLGNALVIIATRDAQEQVEDLLAALRPPNATAPLPAATRPDARPLATTESTAATRDGGAAR